MSAALVVGLVGLFGVIVGGLLQIEGSRRSQIREQQLLAATDFDAGVTGIFVASERRARKLNLPGDPRGLTQEQMHKWLAAQRASVELTRDEARQLLHHGSRVELVFGVGSVTASQAAEAVKGAHDMLEIVADQGAERADEFVEAWCAAVDAGGAFRIAAHDVFSRPVWRR